VSAATSASEQADLIGSAQALKTELILRELIKRAELREMCLRVLTAFSDDVCRRRSASSATGT
jgi:hypothetical protein